MRRQEYSGEIALLRATTALATLFSLIAIGCGSGGSGGSGDTSAVGGAGVKGPLAGAVVRIYAVDLGAPDFKGALLDEGETDSAASLIDTAIPAGQAGHVLLEISADADTTDITTDAAPILTQLATIVEASRVLSGDPVYATPLTTMAVGLVQRNAGRVGVFGGDGDGTVTEAELASALAVAGNQIASTFGFGLMSGIDLFAARPLLGADTQGQTEQAEITAYRTAIEAFSAIAQSITDDANGANGAGTLDNDTVLMAIADDLSDGAINGLDDGVSIADLATAPNFLGLVDDDPSTLMIPGTSTLVSDTMSLLVAETGVTGVTVDTTPLEDGSIVVTPAGAETVPDSDDDSVLDDVDNCIAVANLDQVDTDLDLVGDACDDDDDGDTFPDATDAFPLNPAEWIDTDADGTGNNADLDDDDDGTPDAMDDFPLDATETTDTDQDGIGNNADTDDDGDGVLDVNDAFPTDPNESSDTDGDGTGDVADTDDDADGVEDDVDNCPTNPNPSQVDTDNDGQGDVCDATPGSPTTAWGQFDWNAADWE